jgi:DNA-binding XRE family transcriptional regulator
MSRKKKQKKRKGPRSPRPRGTHRDFTPEEEAIFRQAAAEDDAELEALRDEALADFTRLQRLNEAVQALRRERKAQGLSLADMERRCGITRAALSRLENDPHPNPTIQTLMRIAAALGVELTIGVGRPGKVA